MHHLDIAEFPTSTLLEFVAELLESLLATNDRIPNNHITHFHSRAVPSVTVYSYLSRILKFAPFSNEALLSLLVYFDRIATLQSHFAITSLNVHRLLITSIVVASKFTSDVFYPNARYAKVGGLPLQELNQLELEFLFLCNFDLHIRLEDLQAYGDQLLTHAMGEQPPHVPVKNPSADLVLHDTRPMEEAPRIARTRTTPADLPLTPPYDAAATILDRRKRRQTKHHPYARSRPLLPTSQPTTILAPACDPVKAMAAIP